MVWVSFGLFCLLALGLAGLLKGYWENASNSHEARVSVITGTALVKAPRQRQWVGATSDTPLKDGDRLRTDGASQALLTFFDYSTLLAFAATEVQIEKLASSRFIGRRHTVLVNLDQGKIHLGVAPSPQAEKLVQVATPNGVFHLEEGSYTLAVGGGRTSLRVAERGLAHVKNGGEVVTVHPRQRLELSAQGMLGPAGAQEELVYNGDFAEGLSGWQGGNVLGFKEGADVLGSYMLTANEGRLATRFHRERSKGTHNETYLFQQIDKDVSDFSELRLSLELRLIHQSLSGGGYMGSEYPVLVRINYRAENSENLAVYGFYYQNDNNNRTDYGTATPDKVWVKYIAPDNLMALAPRPQRILSLQVGASGWDYESFVRNISLAGQ